MPRVMRDTDDEIREIKKEIIESRGLIIKTNNLTNSLAADIKSIAKRQAGYERRFNWNSAVAYVLFATLSFVGLKAWSDVRIHEIESEKTELTQEVEELRRDLAEETRRAEERARAEAKAAEYYDLIRKKKREKVVQGFDDIRETQLSNAELAFFRDTVDRFRTDLSVDAYQRGLGLMRTARYSEAAESFQEAMRLADEGAHIPDVKLNLGKALLRLGRPGEASVLAEEVFKQKEDRELQDDAAWLLSHCAEELGDLDEARDMVRTFIRRWPRSSRITDARKRMRDLNQKVMRERAQARKGG